MKRIITLKTLTFCLLCTLLPTFASAQGAFQKVVKYLGEEDYMEQAAFLDSAQAVVGLGYVTDSNNQRLLIRSDLQGNVVWQRAISDGGNDFTAMEYLCVEGNSIFVGGQGSGDTTAAALARFDAQGNLIWNRIFSYFPYHMSITALAGDNNGNVAFGGQVRNVIFASSGMVGKLRASDGATLWMSTIADTVEFDVPYIATTPSGEVVAAGNVSNWPTQTLHYPWIAKWSANGTLLWCKKLDYEAVVGGIKADANWIYLAGSEIESGGTDRMSIARFTQSGALDRWLSLDNPDQQTFIMDMKLDGASINLIADYYDPNSGAENALLMGLDTALNPYFAWLDTYAFPMALAGTDGNGLLHYMGSYFRDPLNDEVIVLGAVPNAPISSIPCGMENFAPSFVSLTPPVLNYAVTTGATTRSGYAQIGTYVLPLVPLTDCSSITAVETPSAQLQVWPNPTTGSLHIQVPTRDAQIMVMGLDGKVMLQTQGSGLMELNLSTLAAGMYLLRVEAADQVFMQRICRL
jgi:Secretion system C-terminal sorting domain